VLKQRGILAALALTAGVVLGWAAARVGGPAGPGEKAPAGQAAEPAWLRGSAEERFAQIESQLRGLDVAMAEIGYRYTELHFAVQDRNWAYAGYHLGKIELALKLAIERRPKRARSAGAFLSEDLPAVQAGIRSHEPFLAAEALERLRTACMKCHVAEDVPYFTVRAPEHRIAPIRSE
jgi:hypothetical protein